MYRHCVSIFFEVPTRFAALYIFTHVNRNVNEYLAHAARALKNVERHTTNKALVRTISLALHNTPQSNQSAPIVSDDA